MAIEKVISTRIVLTHDEYSALKSKTLKAGEVVLAKVGTTEANGKVSEPIWMMKVGDGTSTVANCPWLVAPAADVYEWAKKSSLEVSAVPTLPISKIDGLQDALDGKAAAGHNHDDVYKKIQEAVAESGAADKTLKISQDAQGKITVTPVDIAIAQTQVTGLVDALAGKSDTGHKHVAADITDFDNAVATKVNSMGIATSDTVTALDGRVEAVEGAIDAIKDDADIDSFADVKAELAKKQDTIPANTYDAYGSAAQALVDAKAYTDDVKADILGEGITETFDTLKEIEDWITKQGGSTVELTKAIADEAKAREDADKLINDELATYGDIVTHNVAEFATKAQGDKADTAVQEVATGSANGTIAVDGTDVAVKGLGTAAYKNEDDFVSAAAGLQLNNSIDSVGQAATSAVNKIGVTDWISSDYADSNITKELTRIDGEIDAIDDKIADLEEASATHLTEITTTANNGLKVTNKNNIDIDTDVVFVLNGGDASNLD